MHGPILAALVASMLPFDGSRPSAPLVQISSSPSVLIQGNWTVEGRQGFQVNFRNGRFTHHMFGERLNSGPYQIRQKCPGSNRAPPFGVVYQIDKDNDVFCSEIVEIGQDAIVLRSVPGGTRTVLRRAR